MEIKSSYNFVGLNAKGGAITWWNHGGRQIMGFASKTFPGTHMVEKSRSYWCLPQKGPDRRKGSNQLPIDGTLKNTILERSLDPRIQDKAIFKVGQIKDGLVIRKGEVVVTVEANVNGILTELYARNDEAEKRPVLPAFQACFVVPKEGFEIHSGYDKMLSEEAKADELLRGVVLPCQSMHQGFMIHLRGVGIVEIVGSNDCSHIEVWTDDVTSHVCAAAVFGPPLSYGTLEGKWLPPGSHRRWTVEMNFLPA